VYTRIGRHVAASGPVTAIKISESSESSEAPGGWVHKTAFTAERLAGGFRREIAADYAPYNILALTIKGLASQLIRGAFSRYCILTPRERAEDFGTIQMVIKS